MRHIAGSSLIALVLASPFAFAQGTNPLVGAWKVQESAPANAAVNAKPHPGLYIFTGKHYSMIRFGGTRPLAAYPSPDEASDAEKIATFDALLAQSGSYEVKGNTLVLRPMVAKNPSVMNAAPIQSEFKAEKQTLTLTATTGPLATRGSVKLVRVE
jgi:hypothetical protein